MNNVLTFCRYEWKKIWLRKSVVLSFGIASLFMVAVMVSNYVGNGYEYRYYAENGMVERVSAPYLETEQKRKEYLANYSGQVLDSSLMHQLSQNYSDSELGTNQWNLNDYAPFRYLNGLEDYAFASADEYYDTGRDLKELKKRGATESELAYWQKQFAERESILFNYCGGWQALIKYTGLFSILTMIVLGIGLCPVFSEEHKSQTDQLILSSKDGRTPLFLAKLMVSITFSVLVPVALYGVQLIVCTILFGLQGFSTSLRIWEGGGFLWDYSMGGYSLLMLLLVVIASVMTAMIILFLSEISRSAIPAVIFPFFLSAIPLLNFFAFGGRISLEKFVNYIPTIRISADTLEDYHLVNFFGLQMNCIEFTPVLYFLVAGIFALFCGYCYRRYQVTT